MWSTSSQSFLLFSLGSTALATSARNYAISDTFFGKDFLSAFQWTYDQDGSHGRVNYTDQATALDLKLTSYTEDSFVIRVDDTTVLNSTGPGRNSVRVMSYKQWSTAVTIIDLNHLPQGCSTWPAFWTMSNVIRWPDAGEIDIIEGVNDEPPNQFTLHTLPNCTMDANTMDQTGRVVATDCNTAVNYNIGCGVRAPTYTSFGPQLNAAGGGWFAMERTPNFINMWFWPRFDPFIPFDVRNGLDQVDPAHWGTPYANFVSNNCDFSTHFDPHAMLLKIDLCGDWAGTPGNWPGNVCAPQVGNSTCIDWVNNDPHAFKEAYFDVAAIRVYDTGSGNSTDATANGSTSKRNLLGHRHKYQDWKL